MHPIRDQHWEDSPNLFFQEVQCTLRLGNLRVNGFMFEPRTEGLKQELRKHSYLCYQDYIPNNESKLNAVFKENVFWRSTNMWTTLVKEIFKAFLTWFGQSLTCYNILFLFWLPFSTMTGSFPGGRWGELVPGVLSGHMTCLMSLCKKMIQ